MIRDSVAVATATPLLAARGVSLSVGDALILDDVSLTMGSGELVALVGPNGAGKTTLLRTLAGELRPRIGEVLVDGRPLAEWTPRELARRRAVLPQQSVVELAFTVREVVALGRTPWRGTEAEVDDDRVIERALAATRTEALGPRVLNTLSGGEAARAHLGRVLAQDAPLLLLDEPTAALDLRHQGLVLDAAAAVADAGGAVVAVLHDLNLAAVYADRIASMSAGRIVREGTPRYVLVTAVLRDVYQTPLTVTDHPISSQPLVIVEHRRRATKER